MKTDGLFIQKLVVGYNGKKYAANPISMFNVFNEYDLTNITINTIPSVIHEVTDMEEDENTIKLKFGEIIFDLDEEENPSFKTNFKKEIIFDKTTQRGIGNKLNKDDYNNEYSKNSLSTEVLVEYINAVCKCNKNVYYYLNKRHSYLLGCLRNKIKATNFLNLITFNLLEFEKLINSNNEKVLMENLGDENFELKEASKLHQVVGLPKIAIAAIKDLKLEFALNEIRTLAETLDGNSLKIFFEFIQNMKIILKGTKSYYYEKDMCKFIENFATVSKKGYKTPDLLKFLMRQNFYYSMNGIFTFPFMELGLLHDYLHMADIYKIKVEKYPSQLKKQHDILAKNITFLDKLSPELEKQFVEAVDKYKDVERKVTVAYPCKKGEVPKTEDYVFIVPKGSKDIIQEGNDLHHCVGSYSDRIINGESRIVFMRLAGKEKESLITVDIAEDKTLIEAAGMGNCALSDMQEKALKKWLKEISK